MAAATFSAGSRARSTWQRDPAARRDSAGAVVAWTPARAVVHTGLVDIEIDGDVIRLGQLLKYANVVTDGGEAKALIAGGAVSVDGEVETRRGRQVGIGSQVAVDLAQGRQELRVVHPTPGSVE